MSTFTDIPAALVREHPVTSHAAAARVAAAFIFNDSSVWVNIIRRRNAWVVRVVRANVTRSPLPLPECAP